MFSFVLFVAFFLSIHAHAPCPPGMQQDSWEEWCIPCPEKTYNHGNLPWEGRCWDINDPEILYLNRTDVQCKVDTSQTLSYEHGEYNGGCADRTTPCPPGYRKDVVTENCLPCEKGKYNHGNMNPLRETCYTIMDPEIVYVNATDVKCAPYWKGIPIYENGEYNEGCEDFDPTPSPTHTPDDLPCFSLGKALLNPEECIDRSNTCCESSCSTNYIEFGRLGCGVGQYQEGGQIGCAGGGKWPHFQCSVCKQCPSTHPYTPPFVLPKGLKNVQVFPAMPLKRGELGLSASLHNPVLKLVKFK